MTRRVFLILAGAVALLVLSVILVHRPSAPLLQFGVKPYTNGSSALPQVFLTIINTNHSDFSCQLFVEVPTKGGWAPSESQPKHNGITLQLPEYFQHDFSRHFVFSPPTESD